MILDTFTRAYVECALWSSTDNTTPQGGEPLDANYDIDDIDGDTLAQMVLDCRLFRADVHADLELSRLPDSRAGHDFWLNRNGHGSGFWDEGSDPCFSRLSDAAHVYGSFDLYVGDDGKVYGQ